MRTPWPLLLLTLVTSLTAAPTRFEYGHENVLGTSLDLHVQSATEAQAEQARDEVLRGIDRFAAVVSTWSADSELSRAMARAGAAVPASDLLLGFLQTCATWQQKSQGAFDPRVARLAGVWKAAADQQIVPSAGVLGQTLASMKPAAWTLNAGDRTVTFTPGAELTFDAIAKGWIIDRTGDHVMRELAGVTGLMINIGGDLRVWGALKEQAAMAHPLNDAENARPIATTRLEQQGLATSGGYRRGWDIQKRHYSHLLDPRSGQPASVVLSASVVAPDTATADVLATVFSILSVDESLKLAASLPGVHCLLVNQSGQVLRSEGWTGSVLPAPLLADAAAGALSTDSPAPPAPAQAPGMEMLVDFQLASPTGGKYHRPYVAIWIEDKNGFPLRTLILWIQQGKDGLKYLRDLKRWNSNDKVRQNVDPTSLVQTISSATRKSGQYRAVWDGKDNLGKVADPGNYTLCIEAAREKGTYQLIRHPFVWGVDYYLDLLPGNVEISSASLECKAAGTTAAP